MESQRNDWHAVKIVLDKEVFVGWMGVSEETRDGISKWLSVNNITNCYYDGFSVFRFEHEDDAVAFKMVWGQAK